MSTKVKSAIRSSSNTRRLKEALAEKEACRQLLLDSSLDCIICTDGQARITEFNSTAERVFHLSRSAALGKDLPSLILPSGTRNRCRMELFQPTNDSGTELVASRIETEALRPDGSEFSCELAVSRGLANNRPMFVVRLRDLTARKKAEAAVVWLAAIVESSEDAIIGKDLNGRILSWNRGAEMMYGYSSDEAIGRHISMLAPRDRPDEVATSLAELRKGHQIKRFETVRVAKNGRSLDVALTISPVRTSDGTLVGASTVARDVTADKAAQEALRRATETSIYSSPVPIVAADLRGITTMWNPAAAAVFGWSEMEVIGKRLPIIPPEEVRAAEQLHGRLLRGETLTGVEVRRARKDGSSVIVSLSATPLWDENGKVRGIIGFLTDITDLKSTEQAWRDAEAKYRSIFENAVEGIYQASPDGKYLSANPALARMFGFDSPQELMSARNDIGSQEYIEPELRSTFIRSIEKQGVVQHFDYEARRRDGKQIWLSASARAIRDADGRLTSFEGTVQDVTERRELEQQVRHMQKIEAIGRLAGGVAHDFNNILMAVSSYAELLGRKTTEDSARRCVGEIIKAVNRGSSLTQGLLIFGRKQVACPKVLDLNTLIVAQLDMLKRLIPENVTVDFLPGSGTGSVKADPTQIEQVVMNLVINARDAMPTGGIVTIETWRTNLDEAEKTKRDSTGEGEYAVLTVHDNGCGMDAEAKSHLFEPFYTTKEPGKGTGLGLATVFGIVKQSMGHIFVESSPGHGSTFKVLLPHVEGIGQSTQEEELVDTTANGETILLVEDELAVRESAAEYLTELGYTILKASQGNEALQIVEQHRGPIHLSLRSCYAADERPRALESDCGHSSADQDCLHVGILQKLATSGAQLCSSAKAVSAQGAGGMHPADFGAQKRCRRSAMNTISPLLAIHARTSTTPRAGS